MKRVASGILGMAVVFGTLYLGARFDVRWIAGGLILAVAWPCAVEYLQLMAKLGIPLAAPEFLVWIPALTLSVLVAGGRYAEVALLVAMAYQVLRYLGVQPHRTGFLQAVAGMFGLLYIPWLLHYFYLIYQGGIGQAPHVGVVHAAVVLLTVWGYDSGAFFIGSALGKHKAFPTVSPGKTWEGVAGGVAFALVGACVGASLSPVWREFAFGKGFPHLLVSSLLVSAAAQLGDVFESKLKRAVDVKDSGAFLPGHGGALDRLDGLLFALPVFYFYYHYVVRFF
ncbi:MAG: phosphatidate cytidylyltransferase [Candidatus Bipolaricaulota bacterium]